MIKKLILITITASEGKMLHHCFLLQQLLCRARTLFLSASGYFRAAWLQFAESLKVFMKCIFDLQMCIASLDVKSPDPKTSAKNVIVISIFTSLF